MTERYDTDATISPCGLYRYELKRRWGQGPAAIFIMLNPSTADAEKDDATIRRCVSFAKREGCGGLTVLNLFAFRATKPEALKAAADPVGPSNDEWIAHVVGGAVWTGSPVIAAWGAHGSDLGRDVAVAELVRRRLMAPMLCLGVTKAGAPSHPLYLAADAPLVRWPTEPELAR